MKRLIDFFRKPQAPSAPVLRNKPGGMAWIKGITPGAGQEVINGRAVRTVRYDGAFWLVDPPQQWVATRSAHFVGQGVTVYRGDVVTTFSIVDDCLEPWKDTGLTDEEVRDLYAPNRAKEAA